MDRNSVRVEFQVANYTNLELFLQSEKYQPSGFAGFIQTNIMMPITVHLFLTSPFCPAILKPNLNSKLKNKYLFNSIPERGLLAAIFYLLILLYNRHPDSVTSRKRVLTREAETS